jgi:hypothetical protein
MPANTIHVDAQEPGRDNSEKMTQEDAGSRAELGVTGDGFCYWNDHKYSDGATVCENHTRYECWNGKWVEIGLC